MWAEFRCSDGNVKARKNKTVTRTWVSGSCNIDNGEGLFWGEQICVSLSCLVTFLD